jgi:hypothetical protein
MTLSGFGGVAHAAGRYSQNGMVIICGAMAYPRCEDRVAMAAAAVGAASNIDAPGKSRLAAPDDRYSGSLDPGSGPIRLPLYQ